MSEHLVAYLRSTLADAADGCVPFQWMSDEETAAIEERDESSLTVQPWIEAQEGVDQELAARFGERSLLLRGLLEPSVDEQTGEPRLRISDELHFVADARRLGVAYILARSVYRGERAGRNNVLHSEIGTFEEDIDGDGLHVFSACTYRAALHRLADWALPHAHHSGAEMRTRISADRWQAWIVNELGVDVRAVEMNVFLPGASGALEPETWLFAHGYDAAVLAIPDNDSLRVASMSTSRLEDRLVERVSASLGVEV